MEVSRVSESDSEMDLKLFFLILEYSKENFRYTDDAAIEDLPRDDVSLSFTHTHTH